MCERKADRERKRDVRRECWLAPLGCRGSEERKTEEGCLAPVPRRCGLGGGLAGGGGAAGRATSKVRMPTALPINTEISQKPSLAPYLGHPHYRSSLPIMYKVNIGNTNLLLPLYPYYVSSVQYLVQIHPSRLMDAKFHFITSEYCITFDLIKTN